jgi:hypothetical protein
LSWSRPWSTEGVRTRSRTSLWCLTPWFVEGYFGSDHLLSSPLRTSVAERRSGDRRRRGGAHKNNYKHTLPVSTFAANKPRAVPGNCLSLGPGKVPFATVLIGSGDRKKNAAATPRFGAKMGADSWARNRSHSQAFRSNSRQSPLFGHESVAKKRARNPDRVFRQFLNSRARFWCRSEASPLATLRQLEAIIL